MNNEAVVRPLPAADRTAVAWKNGGGVTREVVASPEGAGMDDFRWRVSMAEVAVDGPFSVFPGVDRTLTVVEGDGLRLTVDGEQVLLDSVHVPRDFAGDAPTDSRLLGGPVVDLNVMWRRDAFEAPPSVAVVRGRLALAPGLSLVVALTEDGAQVAGHTLGRYDAALVQGAADLHATGPTAVVTGV